MVGRGREQVFTPTIQTFQKLERTVKLGLFFYGHFGKVLSLELIFFYKFKLVLLQYESRIKTVLFSFVFRLFRWASSFIDIFGMNSGRRFQKFFFSSFVISRQLVLKISKETRFTRRHKTKSNSFFQTFTMFGERSNYQRSYFYLSR